MKNFELNGLSNRVQFGKDGYYITSGSTGLKINDSENTNLATIEVSNIIATNITVSGATVPIPQNISYIYSDTLNEQYYNPKKLSQRINSGLTSVQNFNYSWVKYNTTGFSYVHSMLYLNDYIYASTRQFPARLGKFNASDLSVEKIITFPGTDSTSLYSIADTLIYSKYKDKLYIPFGDPDFDARSLKIAEIDPDTLDYTLPIDETGNSGFSAGYPKGAAKGNKLYIVTTGAASYKLIEYELDTYTRTNQYYIPVTSTETASSIDIDDEYLYIAEVYGDAEVKKISLSAMTMVDNVAIATKAMSSNSVVVGNNLWVTSLTELDSVANKGFYVLNKQDLSDYKRLYLEDVEDCYGMLYANGYVWASIKKNPSDLLRINPDTFEIRRLTLDTDENYVNKIATDGNNIFFSTFTDPSIIIRMTIPELFDEYYIAGTNNDVLFRVSDTDKRVDAISFSGGTYYGDGSNLTGIETPSVYWQSGSTGTNSLKTIANSSGDATGDYSISFGADTNATGNYSTASGTYTTASNTGSVATGGYTTASGSYSTASGWYSTASGSYSTASGNYAQAHANVSFAFGEHAVAYGTHSFAGGSGVYGNEIISSGITSFNFSHRVSDVNVSGATGDYSAILGGYNQSATGDYSFIAGGRDNITSGLYSFATGRANTASGRYSHAEGIGTSASGTYGSHAEGYYTDAIGHSAHAEGNNTTASGYYASHAQNHHTQATGNYTHSGGFYSLASGQAAFNHSYHSTNNNISGATANYSAILGGYNNNILSTGTHSAILGGINNRVSGTHSVALAGTNNTISGNYSFTTGYYNTASGNYSTASGYASTATGNGSHAEGSSTASGTYSHAEGTSTQAVGNYSHAENRSSFAYGESSHAQGMQTQATGQYSHTEGYQTETTGQTAHAEGYKTKAIGNMTHTGGYYSIATGIYSFNHSSYITTNTTSGTTGYQSAILGGYNNDISVSGISSAILAGTGNTINHARSIILGGYDITTDSDNTVYGMNLNISRNVTGGTFYGDGSNLTGIGASYWTSGSTGTYSIKALNDRALVATGNYSFAMGYDTEATGDYSISMGRISDATGNYAIALGYNNTASGDYSLAEGSFTEAIGTYSHAEGYNTDASGTCSHSEGYGSKANGSYSHSQGYGTVADGDYAHAGGLSSTASGVYSFTHGENTDSTGKWSFSGGRYAQAQNENAFNFSYYGTSTAALTGVTGKYGAILGGTNNIVRSQGSAILGGSGNDIVAGSYSVILGGYQNISNSQDSIIGGGQQNIIGASSLYSGIFAGYQNKVNGSNRTVILGGNANSAATSDESLISGKNNVLTSADYSAIIGGQYNNLSGSYAGIVGGYLNSGLTDYTFVGGGYANKINGGSGAIIAGRFNEIEDLTNYGFIAGGEYNILFDSDRSIILGGSNNYIDDSNAAAVIGGYYNFVNNISSYSVIIGGRENYTDSSWYSTIIGGTSNSATTNNFVTVINGTENLATAEYSAIIAGSGHTLTHDRSIILGGYGITSGAEDTVYARNLDVLDNYFANGLSGYTGSFTNESGHTLTITNGIITNLTL